MASSRARRRSPSRQHDSGITAVTVSGFKSLAKPTRIELGPLTVLAGANSSGKSSIMQPLLLLKQTLESSYDPGALLLDGPNIRFTSADQLLSRTRSGGSAPHFTLEVELNHAQRLSTTYEKRHRLGVVPVDMRWDDGVVPLRLGLRMAHEQIARRLPKAVRQLGHEVAKMQQATPRWRVARRGGFLAYELIMEDGELTPKRRHVPLPEMQQMLGNLLEHAGVRSVQSHIRGIIHVPGLRGNPERSYRTTAAMQVFPGTFEPYVAGQINEWVGQGRKEFRDLVRDLQQLGLAWNIGVEPVDDTRVQVYVSRLTRRVRGDLRHHDRVSIADVGFGVSQTLPVLTALLAARSGQLVHLEQPEIHLHPRAQYALAKVLLAAIRRGVRIVVETHSALLLTGIQTLVAEGALEPDAVKLHWFTRAANGNTRVRSAGLDETGAFGDWPEDFADVLLGAEHRYLTAAESRMLSSSETGLGEDE